MYYESRRYTSRKVSDASEAATLIFAGLPTYTAVRWTTSDGRDLVAVDDMNINGPAWFELAVIDLTNKVQIESITKGWVDNAEILARDLALCEGSGYSMGPAVLALDGEGGDNKATFTCSCCGEGFESTIAAQEKFDQDTGYGYCLSCLRDHF